MNRADAITHAMWNGEKMERCVIVFVVFIVVIVGGAVIADEIVSPYHGSSLSIVSNQHISMHPIVSNCFH